jgi:hypothetical protein
LAVVGACVGGRRVGVGVVAWVTGLGTVVLVGTGTVDGVEVTVG